LITNTLAQHKKEWAKRRESPTSADRSFLNIFILFILTIQLCTAIKNQAVIFIK
jgi:hypothetical protein